MKLVTPLLLVIALVVGISRPARAGQCGASCSTVCAAGSAYAPCDYLTPQACVLGVATGGECRLRGGTYHETIDANGSCPGTCPTGVTIRCESPASEPCVVDGDGVRSNGVIGYTRWVVDGLEIRNTLADAITSIASRTLAAVRNCYIHDVGGVGIRYVDVETAGVDAIIENNTVENTGNSGIMCTAAPADNFVVRNNLVVNTAIQAGNSGLDCNRVNARITHNTVVMASGGAPAYGIQARVARYNVVVGGLTGVYTNSTDATAASSYNLAFDNDTAGFGGNGPQTGNLIGNPLFVHSNDFHLRPGSPAIEAAAGSTETRDLDGAARTGVPDIGAFEYRVGQPSPVERWPRREVIASTPTRGTSPSLIMVPGQGPAALYFDNGGSGNLIYSERLQDGTWRPEIVESNAIMQDYLNASWHLHATDLAIDPETGRPAAVWVEQIGSTRYVRFSRFFGNGCAATGCTSARWSGCSSAVVSAANTIYSVALAFHPTLHFPAVAVAAQVGGNYQIVYSDLSNGSTWQSRAIVDDGISNNLGYGIDLDFDPDTGAAVIAYTRISKTIDTGGVVVATGDLGGFSTTLLPIGADLLATQDNATVVAIDHWANGDLAVAYSSRNSTGNYKGAAYMERVSGGWSSGALPVISSLGWAGVYFYGLDLLIQPTGLPVVGMALDHVVQISRSEPSDWSYRWADALVDTGDWLGLEQTGDGSLLLGYQRFTTPRTVEFRAEVDPGGIDPVAPATCTDSNPCTTDSCSAVYGCLNTQVVCDDSNACTTNACHQVTGNCVYEPIGCDDSDPCTVDSCDPLLGCQHPADDCNDHDPCTTDPACVPGVGCAHGVTDCNDGDVCTRDVCYVSSGCQHLSDGCDDSNACTADSCDAVLGCQYAPVNCSDGDRCTVDSCDPVPGCRFAPLDCGDGDPCTRDTCDGAIGCQHAPDPCDDNDVCTIDSCRAGVGCVHPVTPCDDGDVCTDESCDAVFGCQHTYNIAPCDDNDPATIRDTCLAGFCTGLPLQVALPLITEIVIVSDAPRVVPPAQIAITETIAVADSPRVVPPATIAIVETIAVADQPLLAGLLPDGGLAFDAAGYDVRFIDATVRPRDAGFGDRPLDASYRDSAPRDRSAVVPDAATARDRQQPNRDSGVSRDAAGTAGQDAATGGEDRDGGGGCGCSSGKQSPAGMALLALALGALLRRRSRSPLRVKALTLNPRACPRRAGAPPRRPRAA